MSGRGLSRWTNRGQAWPNAGETYGGWLNVDGQQRRVTIYHEPGGSLGIRIGEPQEIPERTEVVREPVPERAAQDERLRKIAESDVTAKYGPRAFGRKP